MAAQAAFINNLLDAAFGGDTYTGGTIQMGLFKTGLPSSTGVELSGGGYARQTLTYGAASAKVITTSSPGVFTDIPSGSSNTIVAWGVYDGATLIDEGLLSNPFTADVDNNTLEINHSFNLNA